MKPNEYPIGTRIIYNGKCSSSESALDNGKVGSIVGITRYNGVLIHLPKSKHISVYSTINKPASWEVDWASLDIAPQKGEQLLFPFMEKEYV